MISAHCVWATVSNAVTRVVGMSFMASTAPESRTACHSRSRLVVCGSLQYADASVIAFYFVDAFHCRRHFGMVLFKMRRILLSCLSKCPLMPRFRAARTAFRTGIFHRATSLQQKSYTTPAVATKGTQYRGKKGSPHPGKIHGLCAAPRSSASKLRTIFRGVNKNTLVWPSYR